MCVCVCVAGEMTTFGMLPGCFFSLMYPPWVRRIHGSFCALATLVGEMERTVPCVCVCVCVCVRKEWA